MKKIFKFGLVLLLIVIGNQESFAQKFSKNDLIGIWLTSDKSGEIKIFKEKNTFFGKALPKGKIRKDVNNPDPEKRNVILTEVLILKNFIYGGTNKWIDGEVYDPDNGKTYKCTITMKNKKTIEVRGYVGISLFGRTEKWTRILEK